MLVTCFRCRSSQVSRTYKLIMNSRLPFQTCLKLVITSSSQCQSDVQVNNELTFAFSNLLKICNNVNMLKLAHCCSEFYSAIKIKNNRTIHHYKKKRRHHLYFNIAQGGEIAGINQELTKFSPV